MRRVLLFVGLCTVVSACAVEASPEGPEDVAEPTASASEELDNEPAPSTDGTACCAKDYRESNGDTVVCGTRDGQWCCNADNTHCASCMWYECEPPAPAPSKLGLPTSGSNWSYSTGP